MAKIIQKLSDAIIYVSDPQFKKFEPLRHTKSNYILGNPINTNLFKPEVKKLNQEYIKIVSIASVNVHLKNAKKVVLH